MLPCWEAFPEATPSQPVGTALCSPIATLSSSKSVCWMGWGPATRLQMWEGKAMSPFVPVISLAPNPMTGRYQELNKHGLSRRMIKYDDTQFAKHQQFVTRQLSSRDLALYPGTISGLEKGKLARSKQGLHLRGWCIQDREITWEIQSWV